MPEVLRTLIEDDYGVSVGQSIWTILIGISIKLHDCPFIEDLCSQYVPHLSTYQSLGHGKKRQREGQPPIRPKDLRLTTTFCTDFIRSIAQPYFPSLRRRHHPKANVDSDSEDEKITLPKRISWPNVPGGKFKYIKGERIHEQSNELSWVKIRGCKYNVSIWCGF
jgi:hypothetical protein